MATPLVSDARVNMTKKKKKKPYNLTVLGHLLNVHNELLLLLLQPCSLAVKVANGLVNGTLLLTQHFCGRLRRPKEPRHGADT